MSSPGKRTRTRTTIVGPGSVLRLPSAKIAVVILAVVIFLAVFLHKLPEGFTVASLVLASGMGKRNAILAAGLLGIATLLGVVLTSALQGQLKYALPVSGGVTLYVAASDLLPEVNREPNWRMALLVFVGVVSLLIMQALFHV